jgi:DNA (cytosine-5)-methyltransferase 1
MNAIDLYSGVGGWSLGLGMAGINVLRSYEWWDKANLTNERNNNHPTECLDIRNLDVSTLPKADVIVGSPPCTQFSLANRGGRGNILDGLKDVEKFLEAVERLRPRFWAMENIPRLASIMRSELNQGGVLHHFCGLNPTIMVVDSSEWGVPQRRQRCLIGNFNPDLMLSYREKTSSKTLGCVLEALSSDPVVDPIYGSEVLEGLVDHDMESVLSWEEERINRDTKTYHPVYNNMSFPDRLDRPSRTVTATCTRVSRESTIVPHGKGFRRLTLRERASLQSFPVGYQFYGETHSQKQKMIGNALPPLLAYYLAHAMLGTQPDDLPSPSCAIVNFEPPSAPPPKTRPDKSGSSFSLDRKFRAAIPGLRFKSGVRFELSNSCPGNQWRIRFFYGGSKNIKEIILGSALLDEIGTVEGVKSSIARAEKALFEAGGIVDSLDADGLQGSWNHTKEYKHPYQLVDSLGVALEIFIKKDDPLADRVISGLMSARNNPQGCKKVVRHAKSVFAGLLMGSLVNKLLAGE